VGENSLLLPPLKVTRPRCDSFFYRTSSAGNLIHRWYEYRNVPLRLNQVPIDRVNLRVTLGSAARPVP